MDKPLPYTLLDSGNQRKLEKFGSYILNRPCSQAVWRPQNEDAFWKKAHALFEREGGKSWKMHQNIPSSWTIAVDNILFKISPTDFGHLGIFPEQRPFWKWIEKTVSHAKEKRKETLHVLNLFAYSGGSTMAAARGGAEVLHLDASKGMVAWAKENAALNSLGKAPIRWIVDDVMKFLQREQRREKSYHAIILDPPTFGRGTKGEVFTIEEHIIPLLEACRRILHKDPLFVLFSCHTPGFSPTVMKHLMQQIFGDIKGTIDCEEMLLGSEKEDAFTIPSGTYARFSRE